MSETFSRRIALDGAVNFRDIGGYPAAGGRTVRWRLIFRSDNLGNLTHADHRELGALGVRTLVDFRSASERRATPNRLAAATPITSVEIGFLPEGAAALLRGVSSGTVGQAEIEAGFLEHYRRYVTDHSDQFARALSYALEPERLPLLVHCTSGKDRTGFAISALLLALGTPQETILADYELTNSYMRDIAHFFEPTVPADVLLLVKTAQRKYLEAALDQMRASFGSVDAYLARALGLDDAKRARLVELLTDDLERQAR